MKWNYSGDINIRHGGFYWRIPDSGFIDYGHITDTMPLLVNAFHAYWGLNSYNPIGGPLNTPHRRLAHNASLRKFVEKEFLHD